jgi:hypothetical protein
MPVYPYKTDKIIIKLPEIPTINEFHGLLGPQTSKIEFKGKTLSYKLYGGYRLFLT